METFRWRTISVDDIGAVSACDNARYDTRVYTPDRKRDERAYDEKRRQKQ
jgi:hypothetical protein